MTALGKMGYDEAMKPLQSFLLNEQTDAVTRRLALEGLAGSRMGTTWLLEANAKKELPEYKDIPVILISAHMLQERPVVSDGLGVVIRGGLTIQQFIHCLSDLSATLGS